METRVALDAGLHAETQVRSGECTYCRRDVLGVLAQPGSGGGGCGKRQRRKERVADSRSEVKESVGGSDEEEAHDEDSQQH